MSDAARDRATGIAAAAGLVAAVTLASRVVGFARWLVFSGTVGGTCVGETYATANQLPNVLFEVAAGGALAAVVIPLVGRALARQDRAEADRIASAPPVRWPRLRCRICPAPSASSCRFPSTTPRRAC